MRVDLDMATFEKDVASALAVYRELPSAYSRRVWGPALLAAARVLRDVISKTTEFKDLTGTLRKSIRAYRYKNRRGFPPAAFVAAGAGGRHKAYHAHLVEYGHGGPRPAPPHPFFRKGLDAGRARAALKLRSEFEKRAERAATLLIKRFGGGGR